MNVQPFTVQVPEAELVDLQTRLARTRWPDEIAEADWEYGTSLAYLQGLVRYWHERFDWRAQERAINAFAHFRATVGGLGIHFIHQRGKGPAPLPLIITHGWPARSSSCSRSHRCSATPLGTVGMPGTRSTW